MPPKIAVFLKVKLMFIFGKNFSPALLLKLLKHNVPDRGIGKGKAVSDEKPRSLDGRTHCVEGPDGVEVALIWGVAKFGKCSQKSLCFRGLAPVVALQVAQMCHGVDGYGQGDDVRHAPPGFLSLWLLKNTMPLWSSFPVLVFVMCKERFICASFTVS